MIAIEPLRVGGTETWLRELSKQLGEHGWRSVICFLSLPQGPVREFLDLPNVTLDILDESWRSGWRQAVGFARLMRTYRPRIVHLQHTGFISPYPPIASLFSVEKFFLTDQSSAPEGDVPRPRSLWKRIIARAINHSVTRVLCISKYVYERDATIGLLPRNRFSILYNSIDVGRVPKDNRAGMTFRQQYGIPEGRRIIMQVSWLIPAKGLSDLLRAAKEVVQQCQNTHFVMVGEGAGRDELERIARELDVADHVTFTGVVNDPLAQGAFAAADVVCQVSRWEEAFGFVIAEAMASSRPVVATRVGGIPELVVDGVTGWLVDRGDSHGMAQRILQLLKDDLLCHQMGKAGREVAVAKFDVRSAVAEQLRLYGIT